MRCMGAALEPSMPHTSCRGSGTVSASTQRRSPTSSSSTCGVSSRRIKVGSLPFLRIVCSIILNLARTCNSTSCWWQYTWQYASACLRSLPVYDANDCLSKLLMCCQVLTSFPPFPALLFSLCNPLDPKRQPDFGEAICYIICFREFVQLLHWTWAIC